MKILISITARLDILTLLYSFISVHIWLFILVSVCPKFADINKYANIFICYICGFVYEYYTLFKYILYQIYRSHDGYEVNAEGMCVGTNPKYADQRNVFDDLGQGVLNNAFKGAN